jgi:Tol biopolymer transport system component
MRRLLCSVWLVALAACHPPTSSDRPTPVATPDAAPAAAELRDPGEVHFGDVRQLSFGGENAEAYWSFDSKQLIFQTTRDPYACDQIMRMPADGSADPTLVSTGKGRTTCSYFLKGDQEVIFASTHEVDEACPPPPDRSKGYTWALYDYDIYRANPDGSNLHKITDSPGYDAEATVCGVDGSILFTSMRDGDLDLYRMDADGKNVVRLTSTPGYDGGGFFSADCKQIVWRASRPTGEALTEYQDLLKQGLVRPTELEIYVGNADGSDARQVTYFGKASFAPFLYPSGKRIIFSSNAGSDDPREFDIWAVNTDGTQLERITYTPGFDGFPMFSPDGKQLAFASNRHGTSEGETDLFVTDWVDGEPVTSDAAPDRFEAAVTYLASDDLGGRGVGTDGIVSASNYIEQQLREAGVDGGADHAGYRQPFDVNVAIEAAPTTALSIDGAAVATTAFVPLSSSSSATVSGKTVYVGYGISAKGLADDYKGKKVKGKVVVVRRFTPDTKAFADETVRARQSDLHTKAITARMKGAIGMIVIDVPETAKDGKPAEEAALPALDPLDQDGGFVAVAVGHDAGAALLKGSHDVAITVDLARVSATAENIVGVIHAPGKAEGAVVIGAHYDHLGMGGANALDTVHEAHNGADDNASGVAALLEVGRILATHRDQLTRDVYLVAFSGEEMGVLGSTYFAAHRPMQVPIVAMLNMDMVGRMRDDTVQAIGAETAPEWASILEPRCAELGVRCVASGDGYGPSDHMPFFIAKIPVLHFFTGSHLDYHTATDDADKINAAGGAQVAAIVADTALDVATGATLTYTPAKAHPVGGDARIRGSSLGTIPTYTDDTSGKPGLVISDVVPDGPAAKAGLVGGDRILLIGGVEIRTVYDLMYVLENHRPGDKAKLTYERGDHKTTVEVTFGRPRGRR